MTTSTSSPRIEPEGARLVSRAWVQVTALVLLCGLAILGFLGYRAYTADPPIAGAGPDACRAGRLHRCGRDRRAAAVLGQGPDGVRLDLRPRRLPRARLHRRLPAPRGADRRAGVRRRHLRYRARQGDRRLQDQPVRPDDRHAHLHRRAGERVRRAGRPLHRVLRSRERLQGPASRGDHRPAPRSSSSPRTSPGRPGPARRCARTRTTPTPTTGRRSRWSATR